MKIIWIGEDLKTHKIDLSNAINIEIDMRKTINK